MKSAILNDQSYTQPNEKEAHKFYYDIQSSTFARVCLTCCRKKRSQFCAKITTRFYGAIKSALTDRGFKCSSVINLLFVSLFRVKVVMAQQCTTMMMEADELLF